MSNVSQFIGSGWIPLETIEVTSTVTTVDFDSNINDTFNNYVVTSTHTLAVSASIACKLKTGDPSATINTGYRSLATLPTSTATTTNSNTVAASIAAYSGSFVVYFMNLRSSDAFKSIVSQATSYVGGQMYIQSYSNALINTSIINGIQLSSSAISTGKFTLYGIQEL